MEKKIGETFEYDGSIYEVQLETSGCTNCGLYYFNCGGDALELGLIPSCDGYHRHDGKDVVFVKKEEK
ncbi:MAG: hypothetical protein ACRC7S_05710 [Cetobacterium sp.]